jgi:hypothetical protein
MIIAAEDYGKYINNLVGYAPDTNDNDLLAILETQEVQHMLNVTHQNTLPEALYPAVKNRVTGLFLAVRKKDIVGADNTQIATSVKEGDVQINLSGASDEQRLDSIIAELSKAGDLACFRQFQW